MAYARTRSTPRPIAWRSLDDPLTSFSLVADQR
jgi:hypothetical protein